MSSNHIPTEASSSVLSQDVSRSMLLEDQLCFALYSASLAMTKFYEPLLAPLSLTYPQHPVMLVMWEHTEQTVGALSDPLPLDSGTLTPLLKRLEFQGLTTRERDSDEERRVIIRSLQEGKDLKRLAENMPLSIAAAIRRRGGDIDSLINSVTALRDSLIDSRHDECC